MVSLPIGAVRLTQTFLHHDPPEEERTGADARTGAAGNRSHSKTDSRSQSPDRDRHLGHAGSPVRSLSGQTCDDDPSPTPCRTRRVSKILKELSKLNLEQRRALPGIGPRRAEIIIAGAMVFSELMDMCSLRNFRYLPLGLRDGLLAQMLADYSQSSAMKERVESERRDAILTVVKHYEADLVSPNASATLPCSSFIA